MNSESLGRIFWQVLSVRLRRAAPEFVKSFVMFISGGALGSDWLPTQMPSAGTPLERGLDIQAMFGSGSGRGDQHRIVDPHDEPEDMTLAVVDAWAGGVVAQEPTSIEAYGPEIAVRIAGLDDQAPSAHWPAGLMGSLANVGAGGSGSYLDLSDQWHRAIARKLRPELNSPIWSDLIAPSQVRVAMAGKPLLFLAHRSRELGRHLDAAHFYVWCAKHLDVVENIMTIDLEQTPPLREQETFYDMALASKRDSRWLQRVPICVITERDDVWLQVPAPDRMVSLTRLSEAFFSLESIDQILLRCWEPGESAITSFCATFDVPEDRMQEGLGKSFERLAEKYRILGLPPG